MGNIEVENKRWRILGRDKSFEYSVEVVVRFATNEVRVFRLEKNISIRALVKPFGTK